MNQHQYLNTTIPLREAFKRGQSDHARRRGFMDCPYRDIALAHAWERGWSYARERKAVRCEPKEAAR